MGTESRGVILAIQRQPGTNTVAVAKAVRQTLDGLRQQLPASVSVDVLYDRSETIRDSVNDVQWTLLLTFGLVVLVIFFFLRNVSATVIPSLALPMSVVGTFAVMKVLGYNLDNLSLMALTLSLGFVVDDAIVMLENIVRHVEMGKKPMQAALDGAAEIGFTILSMTISLAAVFLPLIFMPGVIGRLFREFSITIVSAILISGVVSLTLTPMMCSRFIRSSHDVKHGRFFEFTERNYQWVLGVYVRSLGWFVRHRKSALAIALAITVGTVWLFKLVPKGLFPIEDTGRLSVITEAAEGTSFEAMVPHQKALMAIVAKDPNVESFMSSAGGGGASLRRQPGADVHQAQGPQGARRSPARRSSRGCAASWRRSRGSAPSRRCRRRSGSPAPRARASTSTRCRGRTWTSSTRWRPSWRRSCATCRACRT